MGLRAVVGMPGQNGERAIDLFGQHGAHQKMWPDLLSEGEGSGPLSHRRR